MSADPTRLASLFEPEPERWGFRGDPELWRRMQTFFRETPLPGDARLLDDLVRDAFRVLTGHSLEETEDFHVEDLATGGPSSGRIHLRFWREVALPELQTRWAAARRDLEPPDRDRLH